MHLSNVFARVSMALLTDRKRYLSSFKADSKHGLDLLDLRNQLPIKKVDEEGRASWLGQAPPRYGPIATG